MGAFIGPPHDVGGLRWIRGLGGLERCGLLCLERTLLQTPSHPRHAALRVLLLFFVQPPDSRGCSCSARLCPSAPSLFLIKQTAVLLFVTDITLSAFRILVSLYSSVSSRRDT